MTEKIAAGTGQPVPADRLAEFFERRRLRLARRAGGILVLGSGAWSVGQAFYGSWLLSGIFGSVALVAFLILVFLRRFRGADLAPFLLSVLLTLVITVGNWYGGGLVGGNASMFLLIPVGAVALTGGRGLWWMIPAVAVVGLMGWLHHTGHVFPNEIPLEQRSLDALLTWLTTVSVVAFLILTYESVNQQMTGELGLARLRAEEAVHTKSQFVAQVSHEIRTPLHGLLGLISLMEGEEQFDRRQELAEQAVAASRMLLGVLGDLLDLSRVEAGTLQLRSEDFSPREAAKRALEVLSARARQKGLDLSCLVAEDVPARLRGDPVRLQQVLLNLLSNAVKYTADGWVRLQVGRVASSGERARLRFTVQDTGRGIPAGEREKIFEPFYQIKTSGPDSREGSGLGLAISRKLVELMGSRLMLESVPGQGSRFWFELEIPLAEPTPAERSHPVAAQAGLNIPSGCTVLVVDDDEINRRLAELMLKSSGCAVTAVGDGAEALSAASEHDFEMVFMDIQMPGMDGFEAGRRLRRLWQEAGRRAARLVAMTAHAGAGDKDFFRGRGMDDVIFKPFEKRTLEDMLRRWTKDKPE